MIKGNRVDYLCLHKNELWQLTITWYFCIFHPWSIFSWRWWAKKKMLYLLHSKLYTYMLGYSIDSNTNHCCCLQWLFTMKVSVRSFSSDWILWYIPCCVWLKFLLWSSLPYKIANVIVVTRKKLVTTASNTNENFETCFDFDLRLE
jgi:hypothetical protein